MSDSLQKIIDDLKDINKYEPTYTVSQTIIRLEALQKQPVAWMDEDGNTIKGTADSKYEFFTVPLIRAY